MDKEGFILWKEKNGKGESAKAKEGVTRVKKIGFTLPINYLTDNASSPSDLLWIEMFPTVPACLAYLGDQGVRSIEINELTDTIKPELVSDAIAVILDAGLQVTLHGWLPMDTSPGEVPELFVAPERALRDRNITQAIPVTLHGHHVIEPLDQDQATAMTVRDLGNVVSSFADRRSLFIPTLEICRAKKGGPVGVTYDEVVDIADKVGRAPLGLCWDVGHSQVNYRNDVHPPFAHSEFARRAIHTHIHDIMPDGRTHGPLLKTEGYIKQCLDILRENGYQGAYNLELYPIRWPGTTQDRKDALTSSIKNLSIMLD
ncbi:MAG TPA: hypothetical protein DDW87_11480 [Firmicutes bacterium]|nr:hypothetical protein [Bacillota bacterium]